MKERLDLTSGGPTPYPRVRGNLFMAENQGEGVRLPEIPKGGTPKPPEIKAPVPTTPTTEPEAVPKREVPPEKVEAAKKAWEGFVGGRELTPDEERLFKHGIPPISGGERVSVEEATARLEEITRRREQREIPTGEGIPRFTLREEREEVRYEELKRTIEQRERTLEAFREREPLEFLEGTYIDLTKILERNEGNWARRLTELDEQKEEEWRSRFPLSEEDERSLEEQYTTQRGSINSSFQNREEEIIKFLNRVAERITQHRRPGEGPYMSSAELLDIVIDEKKSEEFLERVLSLPEGRKEEFYALDFAQEINLRTFLTTLRQIDRKRYDRYVLLWGMRSKFHNMGVVVRAGDVNRFLETSQLINDTHLKIAVSLRGVGQVRQLYEKALASRLGEKPTIRPEDYEWVETWAREEFENYAQKNGLADWEKERALTVGTNMHTVTLRIAEYIVKGKVPERGAAKFASFNFESMTRLLAVYKWIAYRFGTGLTTRGREYFEGLIKSLKESEDASSLSHIGAVEREEFELPALHEASGYESGYRQTLAYLDILDLPEELKAIVKDAENVGQYLSQVGHKDFIGNRQATLEKLIEHTHLSLGVLLAQDFTLEERLGRNLALDLKKKLWGKIAKVLPSRIVYYLKAEKEDFLRGKTDADIKRGISPEKAEKYWRDFWPKLEKKLALLEIERVEKQWGSKDLVELDISSLSAEEQELIQHFQRLGETKPDRLRELAKVKFGGTTAFLDDVPFEHANYLSTGTESFKRRLGSDDVNFFNAGNEVVNLVDNLDAPKEKIRETIKKMVKNLSSPLGIAIAHRLGKAFIREWFKEAKERWWATWFPGVGGICRLARKEISNLQIAFGPTAEALGPRELREELFHYQAEGTQGKDEVKTLQKEFGADLKHVFAHEALNLFVLIAFGWGWGFIEKLFKEK